VARRIPVDVLSLVISGAARVITAGIVIGLVSAAALGQTVSAFLFGVRPVDPLTFGAVTLLLIMTALVAMAAPAMRAARVDPVVAFRSE
jgi:ABC-type antimicrobial peptide transport system permease subunit